MLTEIKIEADQNPLVRNDGADARAAQAHPQDTTSGVEVHLDHRTGNGKFLNDTNGKESGQRRRDWHLTWLACFGKCDSVGWISCCLSTWAPCVAIGWNRRRSFYLDGWFWGILCFVNMVAATINVSSQTKEDCPPDSNDSVARHCDIYLSGTGQALLVLFSIFAFVLGFVTRLQIRHKFGIRGHWVGDCLLWFCFSPCALCQETRTLMYDKVERGVWQGPDAMSTVTVPHIGLEPMTSESPNGPTPVAGLPPISEMQTEERVSQ